MIIEFTLFGRLGFASLIHHAVHYVHVWGCRIRIVEEEVFLRLNIARLKFGRHASGVTGTVVACLHHWIITIIHVFQFIRNGQVILGQLHLCDGELRGKRSRNSRPKLFKGQIERRYGGQTIQSHNCIGLD